MDDCQDTGILLLRAIYMITAERFYMYLLLDGYPVPRQSQQQKQSSSSFSKDFEVKQINNIFENFVAINFQIKVFVAPDFSNFI